MITKIYAGDLVLNGELNKLVKVVREGTERMLIEDTVNRCTERAKRAGYELTPEIVERIRSGELNDCWELRKAMEKPA